MALPIEEAARKDPPSTFLFLPIHLSNSPEIWRFPLPELPESRRSLCPPALRPAAFFTVISEVLQGRAIAPSKAGGASNRGVYRSAPRLMSTRLRRDLARIFAGSAQISQGLRWGFPRSGQALSTASSGAALKPHSSAVLAVWRLRFGPDSPTTTCRHGAGLGKSSTLQFTADLTPRPERE